MSEIKIVRGNPITLFLSVADANNASVNLNDGTWDTLAKLTYQTKNGPEPFSVSVLPTGNVSYISISSEQTSTLNSLGVGYVLSIRASKEDASVILKNSITVDVIDDDF